MTATYGPIAADPLGYEPGDCVGLCLDIDGTVYRSSSVFIETLAFLPYADGITLTPAERRHRRTALTAVAEYPRLGHRHARLRRSRYPTRSIVVGIRRTPVSTGNLTFRHCSVLDDALEDSTEHVGTGSRRARR